MFGKDLELVDSSKFKNKKGQMTIPIQGNEQSQEDRGIIPRCISELFNKVKQEDAGVTVYCSFVQIYNEKIYDLFQDPRQQNPLSIREDRMQGIYVENLSEFVVQNELDCLKLLKRGERNRITR